MKVHERIIDGIKRGVDRHWRYTKDLLRVKPEYLLTISVADALTDGFDNLCGLNLEIKLEEPTHRISGSLLMNSVGRHNYFKTPTHKVIRKGKVDIYVNCDSDSWVIELKGFDPSKNEIKKEIDRLVEFLSVNEWNNKCRGCYLAFPTSSEKIGWIKQKLAPFNNVPQLDVSVYTERIETGEDAEDGMPIYYANCIKLSAKSRNGSQENV